MRGLDGLFIDGSWVAPASTETVEVLDAATGEPMASVVLAGTADVDRAVAAAGRAFDGWAATPLPDRMAVIERGLDLLAGRSEEIARTVSREVGTPLAASREIQVALALSDIELTLAAAREVAWERTIGNSLVVREPVGVVAAITPWNFPLTLFANKLCPALATGCTIVLKPASTTPLATQRAIEAINGAGFPPGVINTLHGSGSEVGDALVSHPKVNKIAFTGQTATGKRIMQLAAKNVTRVTLELGGSDAMIVADDADIRRATAAAAIGRFFNAGQACLAVKRIFLFEKIAEEFMTKFTERAQKEWKMGDAFAADTKMGPLHTETGRNEVEAQVADAVKRGAKVLAGGKRPDGAEYAKGWFYPATVLSEVPEDSRMATEEVFGPAVPLFIVKELDEAIAKANSSIYGLGSSIFTKDMAKARKAAEQLDAGYTWVNDIQVAYDQLPFGGAKQSGFGKEHGMEAIESYTEKKSVVLGSG